MHLRYLLAALSVVVSVSAVVVRDTSACDGATVISTTTINVHGNTVIRTTSSCPKPATEKRDYIADACGETFTSQACTEILNSPFPSDCTILTEAISLIEEEDGSTFELDSGTLDELTFGTCTSSISNTAEESQSFCWSERSTGITTITETCFDTGDGSAGEYFYPTYSHSIFRAGA